MLAVISGTAGVAFLHHDRRSYSIHFDAPGEEVPRQLHEYRLLFGEARDLQFFDDLNVEDVRHRLLEARNSDDALHLLLILFDAELSQDIRQEAACDLESLLESRAVVAWAERILYAAPSPEASDTAGAILLCPRIPGRTRGLIEELRRLQSIIQAVHSAWNDIPRAAFSTLEERVYAKAVVVREGLFRALVLNRAEEKKLEVFLLEGWSNQVLKTVGNYRQILQSWVAPFRQTKTAPTLALEEEPDSEPEEQEDGRSKRRRLPINSREILGKVEAQKEAIVRAMEQRNLTRVHEFVDELVDYQLSHGGPSYAVKSLCDLAMEAQKRGMHALQRELTKRSTEVGPDDGWSWAQHGKALLNIGDFEGALAAYDSTIREHPEKVSAKNGRAEVLKSLNRLDEALAAYDSIIREHSENVSAKTGRAEVLKSLNRLDEALTAYDSIIREHSENVIARNGRACVLASMGKSREALKQLSTKLPVTVDEWVGYHIRGMILLRMGKLDDAIRIFEHGIQSNPRPASRDYFRTAMAVAKLRQRDYSSVCDLLDTVKTPALRNQTNVLRIHAFGGQGQFDQAEVAYHALPDMGSRRRCAVGSWRRTSPPRTRTS